LSIEVDRSATRVTVQRAADQPATNS